MRTITHVAIRVDGVVHSLPAPNRHENLRQQISMQNGTPSRLNLEDYGFLDSDGRFLNRKQAGAVAVVAGQAKPGSLKLGELTSEDLW